MLYSIVGDAKARQFFYINPDTGAVTIKRLLSEDKDAEYNVSVITTALLLVGA